MVSMALMSPNVIFPNVAMAMSTSPLTKTAITTAQMHHHVMAVMPERYRVTSPDVAMAMSIGQLAKTAMTTAQMHHHVMAAMLEWYRVAYPDATMAIRIAQRESNVLAPIVPLEKYVNSIRQTAYVNAS